MYVGHGWRIGFRDYVPINEVLDIIPEMETLIGGMATFLVVKAIEVMVPSFGDRVGHSSRVKLLQVASLEKVLIDLGKGCSSGIKVESGPWGLDQSGWIGVLVWVWDWSGVLIDNINIGLGVLLLVWPYGFLEVALPSFFSIFPFSMVSSILMPLSHSCSKSMIGVESILLK